MTSTNWSDFGGDPDHDADIWIVLSSASAKLPGTRAVSAE